MNVIYINEEKLEYSWSLKVEDAIYMYSPAILYEILSGKKYCYRDRSPLRLTEPVNPGMKISINDTQPPLPFICTNVINSYTSQGMRDRFAILTIATVPVGVIGISSKKTINNYNPEMAAGVKVLPIEKTVRKYSSALKGGGVKIIVVLSKAGPEEDFKLAQKIPEIDIIINGVNSLAYPTREEETWIIPQGTSIDTVEEVFGLSLSGEVRFFFSELLRAMRKLF